MFFIPAKMSSDGRRKAIYKPNRSQAYDEIQRLKSEWREHGKAAITDEERHYISIARTELGDLSKLPQVLQHWRLTGPDSVIKTTVKDAAAKYLNYRATLNLSRKSAIDDKSVMRRFIFEQHCRYKHELTVAELRE